METINLNFSGKENIIKSICWILSVLSWALLIITGWLSLKWLKHNDIIWTIIIYENPYQNALYAPFQMHISLIYITFIIAMLFTLASFIIYMIKSTCKKDDSVFEGMMGSWTKFHFFPLLCISTLFIIGECVDIHIYKEDHEKDMYICGLVFTIIGLSSLIFIYIMTDLRTNWYIQLLIKKGTYSCFIILMWYYFCYNVYYIRKIDFGEEEKNWKIGCGLAFSIIFGIGALLFAFIFRDLIIAGMTTLIYIGLSSFYFNTSQYELYKSQKRRANNNADGIIDIIMMLISVILIVFLLIKKRDECIKPSD